MCVVSVFYYTKRQKCALSVNFIRPSVRNVRRQSFLLDQAPQMCVVSLFFRPSVTYVSCQSILLVQAPQMCVVSLLEWKLVIMAIANKCILMTINKVMKTKL